MHETNAVEPVLLQYVHDVCLPHNSTFAVTEEMNLFDAGIVDSAGLISFIGFVEREFGITIPDEDLLPANFKSIRAIATYIRSRSRVHYELH